MRRAATGGAALLAVAILVVGMRTSRPAGPHLEATKARSLPVGELGEPPASIVTSPDAAALLSPTAPPLSVPAPAGQRLAPAGPASGSRSAGPPGLSSATTSPPAPPPASGATGPAPTALDGAGLYVVGVDGSGLRRLAPAGSAYPAWSPDGTAVSYVRPATGAPALELRLATLDGQDQLLAGNETTPQPAAWSPDGSRLAYPGPGASPQERDPWVVTRDGRAAPQELSLPGDDANVDWGSGGRLVTMGSFGLAICDSDGSHRQLIYNQPLGSGVLRWSPDASTIAALPDGQPDDLLIGADGTGARQLGGGDGSASGTLLGQVDWAPTSHQLVYWENARRTGHPLIEVASSDGSQGAAIAQDGAWPAWSPRGSVIAAVGNADPEGRAQDLFVMTASGTDVRSLAHAAVPGLMLEHARFSADGHYVAFDATG